MSRDLALQAAAGADVRLAGSRVTLGVAPASTNSHGVSLVRYEALYRDGRVIAATPRFAPPLRENLSVGGCCFDVLADVRLRAALVPVPRQPGVELLVELPRTDLDSDMALLRRSMLMVFSATVAWTVLLAGIIVGRLTRGHRRITAVARRVAGGDLGARVGTATSSPEVAQLGRDIDEMIDRLAVLVASQQQFIAHAAHELRSPLTTLHGELSLAVRRERGAAEYRGTIEEALDSTRRLKLLAEDHGPPKHHCYRRLPRSEGQCRRSGASPAQPARKRHPSLVRRRSHCEFAGIRVCTVGSPPWPCPTAHRPTPPPAFAKLPG